MSRHGLNVVKCIALHTVVFQPDNRVKIQHALEQQIAQVKNVGASEVFVDVESGRKARANFQRLMDLVHSGMMQEAIVTRWLDRLARSLPTLRRILDEFQASGVNFKALDESIDLQSTAGKFHINLLGAVAEIESDRIIEKVLKIKQWYYCNNTGISCIYL